MCGPALRCVAPVRAVFRLSHEPQFHLACFRTAHAQQHPAAHLRKPTSEMKRAMETPANTRGRVALELGLGLRLLPVARDEGGDERERLRRPGLRHHVACSVDRDKVKLAGELCLESSSLPVNQPRLPRRRRFQAFRIAMTPSEERASAEGGGGADMDGLLRSRSSEKG